MSQRNVVACRVPKGRAVVADDSPAEQPGGADGQDGSQSAAVDMDADSDEERWHDSDGEEQELTIDSSESPLGALGYPKLTASRLTWDEHKRCILLDIALTIASALKHPR